MSVNDAGLVRYWFTFDLAMHEPPAVAPGTVRLDGDSHARRLLWKGAGVTGLDEAD